MMMKNNFGLIALVSMGVVFGLAPMAAAWDIVDPSSFSLLTEAQDVGDMGTAIVAGLTGMWGLRKVIKTINRS